MAVKLRDSAIWQGAAAARLAFIDLVFPAYCLGCGSQGEEVCTDCRSKIPLLPKRICPSCKTAGCVSCFGSPLGRLWTLSDYHDFLSAESIKKIKYGYATGLIRSVWRPQLDDFWQRFRSEIEADALLVPVPLHRHRRLQRGFNQSEIIAGELVASSGLEAAAGLLRRIIATEPQVGLNGPARVTNVKGIFGVDYRFLSGCWGREIILVDDVYTTGSTMAEAARTLKRAGFARVSGLVLAAD